MFHRWNDQSILRILQGDFGGDVDNVTTVEVIRCRQLMSPLVGLCESLFVSHCIDLFVFGLLLVTRHIGTDDCRVDIRYFVFRKGNTAAFEA